MDRTKTICREIQLSSALRPCASWALGIDASTAPPTHLKKGKTWAFVIVCFLLVEIDMFNKKQERGHLVHGQDEDLFCSSQRM